MSGSLLSSVATIWQNNTMLCALVPYDHVYAGRIPSTRLYRFPYVSIVALGGVQYLRTGASTYSYSPLSFHIWVDEDKLEFAEYLADKIADVYANTDWALSTVAKVIDVREEGDGMAHQTDLPSVKAWELVKMFSVFVEHKRVDNSSTCPADFSDDEPTSGS